ncbi:L-asparaginase [Actinomycetales bacterium JB111]|nr:L-asparaginase [Actinomycetales bacterium JB111]
MTVAVVTMGGTIATAITADGALPSETHAGALADLLAARGADARVVPFRNTSSRQVGAADMAALAAVILAEIADGASGIVVTHGTDTLEETAYGLELVLGTRPGVPVALTGAMRGPGQAGADGDANVLAAVAAASDERLAEYGPVVVFADEIHLARHVTKVSSTRVDAFGSPGWGPVGSVVEGSILLRHGVPATDHGIVGTADVGEEALSAGGPDVEIVHAYGGATGTLLAAAADRLDGVVVAGTGGGHTALGLTTAVKDVLKAGTPVVLTSRCPDGEVLRETYGGEGSELDLLGAGAIHGRGLHPTKARLRLAFALAAGVGPAVAFAGEM